MKGRPLNFRSCQFTARRPEGWKHIKRVASERRPGDGPDVHASIPETLPTTMMDTGKASSPTKTEHLTPDGKIPPVTAGQKFLWDVSLEEEDEEVKASATPCAPKLSTTESTANAPTDAPPNVPANSIVNDESNVPNNHDGRSSLESASSPDAAVPYSPQPMDESKSPNLNARETAKIASPVDDTTKPARTSTDSEGGGNGGFKAAMRRGTIGKLLAKSGHGNRRSSKDEAAATTDEPEPRTSNA